VTIPKAIADRYGIEPGEEIDFLPAGDAIRVVLRADRERQPDRVRRLSLFDRATERQRARDETPRQAEHDDRGWRRDELYGSRGGAR
jgi:bifunctional DNA-binding transcriptional regulator/antitoxin component of YhaV-PrlF toxin-antitoxin module